MATSKKIVDTRKLASKGRHGDTKLRDVGGEISHVNAYEAYLIDNYNKRGEDAVKAIGSGTINPETGRREYWHGGDHWEIFKDYVKESPLGERWGEGPFQGGSAQFLGDPFNMAGDTPLEIQSRNILAGGMENLQTQYGQYIGPEGFLTQEKRIREDEIKGLYDTGMDLADISTKGAETTFATGTGQARDVYSQTTDKISTGTRNVLKDISKNRPRTNLAYSGTVEGQVGDIRREALTGYTTSMDIAGETKTKQLAALQATKDIGLEKIDVTKTKLEGMYGEEGTALAKSELAAEKAEADFMASLRKQMNQMVIDYQSATGGETYPGGPGMDELNRIFAEYGSDSADV